jgi:hypothetical protein
VTRGWFQLAFDGAEPRAFVEGALASGLLPAGPPERIKVDAKKRSAAEPLAALAESSTDLAVAWEGGARLHINRPHDRVFVDRTPWDVTVEGTCALVRGLPFEAATTSTLDPTWWEGHRSIHGWAFLLNGRGHRLVSPRVLERGPWRTHRDGELTLIQFHELGADAATALAQARPGHALLEPMWLGGHFASTEAAFRSSAGARAYKPSFYDAKSRTSIVLVQDREVAAREMGVAAATRIHQVFPEPVEQVAFVFMDEAAARRHLPEMWLYGLEVRAMSGAGERRIDEDYQPPPHVVPDWVRAS